MLASTLALAAACLGVIQSLTLLGQARTLRRLGTAREVSLPFLFLAVLCSTTWLGYGIVHHDVALLLVNAVGLAGAAVTLTTAVRLRAGDADNPTKATRATKADNSDNVTNAGAPFDRSLPELATASAA